MNEEVDKSSERTWATMCHLAALAAITCIPFANILGPLIVWLIKKDQMPLVDENGKKSVNFQISISIYAFALMIIIGALWGVIFVLSLILPFFAVLFFVVWILGAILALALFLAGLGLAIVAGIKVNNGESYDYPFTLNLIK